MPSFAHQTTTDPPFTRMLPIGFIRVQCESVARKAIDKGTFSNWCERFGVSGAAESEVSLDVAAGLLTCSMLHWLEARTFSGRAYNHLYPLFKSHLEEIYGPRNSSSAE
jgi:hypothetical protein